MTDHGHFSACSACDFFLYKTGAIYVWPLPSRLSGSTTNIIHRNQRVFNVAVRIEFQSKILSYYSLDGILLSAPNKLPSAST